MILGECKYKVSVCGVGCGNVHFGDIEKGMECNAMLSFVLFSIENICSGRLGWRGFRWDWEYVVCSDEFVEEL